MGKPSALKVMQEQESYRLACPKMRVVLFTRLSRRRVKRGHTSYPKQWRIHRLLGARFLVPAYAHVGQKFVRCGGPSQLW